MLDQVFNVQLTREFIEDKTKRLWLERRATFRIKDKMRIIVNAYEIREHSIVERK